MASILRDGNWKGVIVTPSESFIIYMRLEEVDGFIVGQYEVDALSQESKGDLLGFAADGGITLVSTTRRAFQGSLHGDSLFFGKLAVPQTSQHGTLTMFHVAPIHLPTIGIYSGRTSRSSE